MDIRELPKMLFDLFVTSETSQEFGWTYGKTAKGFVVAWQEQYGSTYFIVADRRWTPSWRIENPGREFLEIKAGSRGTGTWSAHSGNRMREGAWINWNANFSLKDEVMPVLCVILWKAIELAEGKPFETMEYWSKQRKEGEVEDLNEPMS